MHDACRVPVLVENHTDGDVWLYRRQKLGIVYLCQVQGPVQKTALHTTRGNCTWSNGRTECRLMMKSRSRNSRLKYCFNWKKTCASPSSKHIQSVNDDVKTACEGIIKSVKDKNMRKFVNYQ